MEFRITTSANTAGAKEAAKSLEATKKAAEGLNDALKEAVPGLGKAQSVISGIAKAGGPAAAGIAAVAVGIGAAAASVKEFAGAEESFAKLDAALARSGQFTDEYREKIAGLAGEFAKATGKDDDEWLSVITRLTQFGAKESNIEAATEAVKNLAGILDGDLQGAAMMVSKALQGQFDLFGRYGLKISDTGTQAQKLDRLFSELANRGGGQLEAQMQTLSGKTTTLWNNIKDVTKGIGGWIASTGIIQGAIGAVSVVAETWAEKLEKIPDKLKGLTNAAQAATSSIEDQKKAVESLKAQLDEIEKAYERQQKQLESQQSARDKVITAQKNYDLAMVDEAEKKGRISKPEAILRRAGIEGFYEDIKTTNAVGDLEQKRQGLLYKSDRKASRISDLQKQVEIDNSDKGYDSNVAGKRNSLAAQMDQEIERLQSSVSAYESSQSGLAQTGGAYAGFENPEKRSEYNKNRAALAGLIRQRAGVQTFAPRLRPGADSRLAALKANRTEFINEFTNETGPALESISDQMGGIQRAYGFESRTRNLNTETGLYGSIRDQVSKRSGNVSGSLKELGDVYNYGWDSVANMVVNMRGTTEARIRKLEEIMRNTR